MFVTAEVSRRRLCRCAFGMAAAVATLQPDLLAEFEATHRPCAPGECVCTCLFCVPGGPRDQAGASAGEVDGDKRVVVVENGGEMVDVEKGRDPGIAEADMKDGDRVKMETEDFNGNEESPAVNQIRYF